MPVQQFTVPTPTPTGGRRNKTSRIKNSPQQMLEEINGSMRNLAEILEGLDPAAIEPAVVRRLTVELRTSANTVKKYAHKLEQHHAKKTPPVVPGATNTGPEASQEPTANEGNPICQV